jgi:hypothetical protein
MKTPPKVVRVLGLASSLTLLTGYVVYSHVTPNEPPPDLLAFSSGTGMIENPTKLPGNDLRIISSKVINQPVFSVRKVTWGFGAGTETGDPFKPAPHPYRPPPEERVGTWFPGFEMTGLSIDPLRKPDKP